MDRGGPCRGPIPLQRPWLTHYCRSLWRMLGRHQHRCCPRGALWRRWCWELSAPTRGWRTEQRGRQAKKQGGSIHECTSRLQHFTPRHDTTQKHAHHTHLVAPHPAGHMPTSIDADRTLANISGDRTCASAGAGRTRTPGGRSPGVVPGTRSWGRACCMLWSTPGGGGGPTGGPSSGLLADRDRLVEGRRPRTDAAAVSGTVACLPGREGVHVNELRLGFSNTTRNVRWGEVDGGTHVRQAACAINAPNPVPQHAPHNPNKIRT